MRFCKLFLLILPVVVVIFSACSTTNTRRVNKDFNYLQSGFDSMGKVNFKDLLIQPNDVLSIQVYSGTLNQEQVAIFALANSGGSTLQNGAQQQNGQATFGYLVDNNGEIILPIIGKMKVAGLTRASLSNNIANLLQQKEIVKNPNVIVRFLQLKINVLGEVKGPGTKTFTVDRVTIFDAIAAAGDLTDRGLRDKVLVIREQNNERKKYVVDLRSAALLSSEVYQLQQNDVVYVYANNYKLKEVNYNPNVTRDLQIGGALIGVVALLLNIFLLLR